MSAHAVTIAGYLVLVAGAAVVELVAHRPASRIPSLGLVLGRIMSTRTGRLAVMAGWAWLGLHFLAL